MGQFSTQPDASARGAQRRIYAKLRTQIENGMLAAGTKLVSTRAMAAELGVSRTTVTAAYEQLAAEGFVTTAAGKSARVADGMSSRSGRAHAGSAQPDLPPALSLYGQRVAALQPYSMASPLARIDFRYGSVASRDFPTLGWQRAYRTELVKRGPSLYHAQPEGEERLRRAIQSYLRRARGLECATQQIVVVHGSQQGARPVCPASAEPGRRIRLRGAGLSHGPILLRGNGGDRVANTGRRLRAGYQRAARR